MVFRKPRAVFFLVLVVVLCSWPVRRVFVGQGGAEPRPQRSRMRSSPCQNDWKADSFESSRVPLEIGEHRPMIDGRPLEVGALVGFELYEFSKLIHVGIYAGRGDERLRNLTGVKSLSPLKHYVIEFSGPCQRSNSMISQVGLVIQGQGGQCIHIAELTPSFNWHMYEINSIDYGPPLSGEETLRRAVGQIGTQFGGYDVFGNNCQHFAVWARYNKTKMLPPEEQLQAKAGTMYQELVDFKWVYANHELQKIMPEWEVQIQEKEKMWKRLQEVTEEKQEEEMEEMMQHLRWEVRILRIPEMLGKMRRRLQEEVGSTLGGYDWFRNNCQHFDLEREDGVLWCLERKLWRLERKLELLELELLELELLELERRARDIKRLLTLLQNQIIDSIDYSTI